MAEAATALGREEGSHPRRVRVKGPRRLRIPGEARVYACRAERQGGHQSEGAARRELGRPGGSARKPTPVTIKELGGLSPPPRRLQTAGFSKRQAARLLIASDPVALQILRRSTGSRSGLARPAPTLGGARSRARKNHPPTGAARAVQRSDEAQARGQRGPARAPEGGAGGAPPRRRLRRARGGRAARGPAGGSWPVVARISRTPRCAASLLGGSCTGHDRKYRRSAERIANGDADDNTCKAD